MQQYSILLAFSKYFPWIVQYDLARAEAGGGEGTHPGCICQQTLNLQVYGSENYAYTRILFILQLDSAKLPLLEGLALRGRVTFFMEKGILQGERGGL